MSGTHDYCISQSCEGKFRRAYYTKVNGAMTKCRSCWESEKTGTRQTRTDVPKPRRAHPDMDNLPDGPDDKNLDDLLLKLAQRAEKEDAEPDYLPSQDGEGEEDYLREGDDGEDGDGMAESKEDGSEESEDEDWWKPEEQDGGEGEDDGSEGEEKEDGEDDGEDEGLEGEGEEYEKGGEEHGEEPSEIVEGEDEPPPNIPPDIEQQIDDLVKLCDGRYVRLVKYSEDQGVVDMRFATLEESEEKNTRRLFDLKEKQDNIKTEILQEVEEITKDVRPLQVTIQGGSREPGTISGLRHAMFDPVLQIAALGINQMLVGPAGSGKTTLAAQVAQSLNLDFYFTGALQTKYDIIGFIDGNGIYHRTAFRNAFENGGVFLWDEIDSSDARAMVAFNSALENDSADFPDGNVKRHPDFISIASANTYGRGADRMYIGRNHLDAATLDRFVSIELDYDKELETEMFKDQDSKITLWVMEVQRVRANAQNLKSKEIISPRASINGAKMLMAGMDKEFVKKAALFKGMDYELVEKLSVGVF